MGTNMPIIPRMSIHQLNASGSLLFIVDIQERLLPSIPVEARNRLLNATTLLVEAAKLYSVPITVSEQYPKGLGPTVESLAVLVEPLNPYAKTEFSGWRNEPIATALNDMKPQSVIICGIEAHICVLQTALDLIDQGYNVHIASDAIASRDPANYSIAKSLMRDAGAVISSSETIAFQWAKQAGTPEFKALSKLVR